MIIFGTRGVKSTTEEGTFHSLTGLNWIWWSEWQRLYKCPDLISEGSCMSLPGLKNPWYRKTKS